MADSGPADTGNAKDKDTKATPASMPTSAGPASDDEVVEVPVTPTACREPCCRERLKPRRVIIKGRGAAYRGRRGPAAE